MYIHRVVLKDVPGIPDRDLMFFDDWRGEPINSVLLTGPNGTGKTAILRTIGSLWDQFGGALTETAVTYHPYNHTMHFAGLAAMEIRNFVPSAPPIWLFAAQNSHRNIVDALVANDFRLGYFRAENGGIIEEEGADAPEWLAQLSDTARKLQLGVTIEGQRLPNMVFIEAQNRQIRKYNPVRIGSSKRTAIQPEPEFSWLTSYDAQDRDAPLERKLANLKIRDVQWFRTTLDKINNFLQQNGKSLTDFDDYLRLRIEILSQAKPRSRPSIDELSSGEQQCLIIIYMISRWLMPGGVVLIDEPDLHLHVSWQRQFIHEIENLVAEKKGQLIVASHSPTLWEEYGDRQRFDLVLEPQL